MKFEFWEAATDARLMMTAGEREFARYFFRERDQLLNAIVWNRGGEQEIVIDEMRSTVPANSFFTMNVSHSFRLERPEEAIIWQFNREFYCIVTHDSEVSCVGLLFYNWREGEAIALTESETRSFSLLAEVFQEEFQQRDNIQGEMLRVLLKRLIIKLTRLVKAQFRAGELTAHELDLVRQYHLLVENHYKKLHQVQDYAALLHKSPKTLSNVFAKYSSKSPVQIIAERLFMESKRLLRYTELSSSGIGYELGFEEPAHFSRFFRKMSRMSPSEFRARGAGADTVTGSEEAA